MRTLALCLAGYLLGCAGFLGNPPSYKASMLALELHCEVMDVRYEDIYDDMFVGYGCGQTIYFYRPCSTCEWGVWFRT